MLFKNSNTYIYVVNNKLSGELVMAFFCIWHTKQIKMWLLTTPHIFIFKVMQSIFSHNISKS